MKILIGADIVPTASNERLFIEGGTDKLLGTELSELIEQTDYMILNLEVPLTDRSTPIEKAGANLIANTGTIEGLRRINPYLYGLANNHILDQGEQGLRSTIELLDKYGLDYCLQF